MRRKAIVANWKMNMDSASIGEFCSKIQDMTIKDDVIAGICVPALYFTQVKTALDKSKIKIGAQNAYFEEKGAYTGEISTAMLKDAGAELCIVGHSERRQLFGDTDEIVSKKLKAVLSKEITPILCVGEVLAQREEGTHKAHVKKQIESAFSGIGKEDAKKIIVAYEPIWAIGTGKVASAEDAEEMCGFIRSILALKYGDIAESILIQYGGSVKPENISELMKMQNIDGALVGGASLEAQSFESLVMKA